MTAEGLPGRRRDVANKKGLPAPRPGSREGRAVAMRRTRPATSTHQESPNLDRNFHFRALRRAWSRFSDGDLSHWTTALIIALSLTIYGAFVLLLTNADTALNRWEVDNLVTVFLAKDCSTNQMNTIRSNITQISGIQEITTITPGEAMNRMKNMFGTEAGLLDDLADNPLPYSLEFQLPKTNLAHATEIANKIGTWSGVEAVSYDHVWAEKMASIVRVVRYTGVSLLAMLLTAVALIISNTIKLTITARSDEVEVMRFMGATDAFIKTPFIYEGILQGMIGAISALLLTTLLYWGAKEVATDISNAFDIRLALHFLSFAQLTVILGIGFFLGLVGALISLSRFLEV